jgi:tetratricopeptide (TPR) repeat protein
MKSISKLKDEARRHEQQEEWEKAIQVYLQVLRAGDDGEGEVELPLFNRIGDLMVRLGRPHEAVRHYEQAADRYAEIGLFNNAIALCNKALRYQPDHLELMRKLGQFSASQGFLTDARRYFLDYAERKFASGETEDALSALQDFADLADDGDIRELLGRRLQAHGRTAEAVTALHKAHALHQRSGDTDRAAAVLDLIHTIDPDGSAAQDGAGLPEQDPVDLFEDVLDDNDWQALPRLDADTDAVETEADGDVVDDPIAHDDDDVLDVTLGGASIEGFEHTAIDSGAFEDGVDFELAGVEVDLPESQDEEPPAAVEGLESTMLDAGAATDALDSVDFGLDISRSETGFDLNVDDYPGGMDVAGLDVEGLEVEVFDTGHATDAATHVADHDVAGVPDDGLGVTETVAADLPLPGEGEAAFGLPLLLPAGEGDAGDATGQEEEAGPDGPLPDVTRFKELPSPTEASVAEASVADSSVADSSVVEEPGPDAAVVAPVEPAADPTGDETAAAADDGFIDLAALLHEDEPQTTRFQVTENAPTGDDDADFAELLNQFKAKVSENLPTEDAAAHYDLALAFKEMGLLDEAIGEFQIAFRAERMRLKICEELGDCFLQKRQYSIAEKVLLRALQLKRDDDLELLGIYYHLGRTYEELGRIDEARDAFERVLALDINFQDVPQRMSRF